MKLVIYGNGSIARLLFSYAKRKYEVAAFTVDEVCMKKGERTFCGLPLIPFSKVQDKCDPKTHKILIAVGFIEMNAVREKKSQEAAKKGYSFASYIHDSFLTHDNVSIGENSIVLDQVSIHPGCKIGKGTMITSNVNIGHDCVIEDYCWINSGVAVAGGAHIGKGSFLGINASIGHGVIIGKRNFIAANTLVVKKTKDDEVYLSKSGELFKLKSKAFLKFSRVLD